jgi:hypothetical protein
MVEESCKKICTGYVHVNHADDRRSYISLNELALFTVITATAFVYVTLLFEAVMFLISEKQLLVHIVGQALFQWSQGISSVL